MALVATAVPAFRTRRARPPLVLHVVFLRASPNAEMQSYHDGMNTSTGELEVTLRKSGHRLTGPRRAISTVLAKAGSHLTADEIADRVRTEDPSVNLSSIYRSPSLFSDPGIVRESNLAMKLLMGHAERLGACTPIDLETTSGDPYAPYEWSGDREFATPLSDTPTQLEGLA